MPSTTSTNARLHHHSFTHTFVPSLTITDERHGAILAGFASGRGQEVMQQAWLRSGPQLGAEIVPGDQLEVRAFQHESCLCVAFLFPPPQRVGEAHAGLVVAGPVSSLSPDSLVRATVRYFVLELAAHGTTLLSQWTPNGFAGLGPGPIDPHDFTDVVFARIFPRTPPALPERKPGGSKHYDIDLILKQETNKALCELCGALERAGGLDCPGALNESETTFLAGFNCWGEIECDGIGGWLRNHPETKTLPRACQALRALGANRRAEVLWKVASLFDKSVLPANEEQYTMCIADRARDEVFRELEQQIQEVKGEDMEQLLHDFVTQRVQDFRPH